MAISRFRSRYFNLCYFFSPELPTSVAIVDGVTQLAVPAPVVEGSGEAPGMFLKIS